MKKIIPSTLLIFFLINILNASTFKARKKNIFMAHRRSVTCVVFSPDSKKLASVSFDRKTKVWNSATKRLINKFHGHSNWLKCVAFSPNGEYLASAGLDKKVIVREADSGKVIRTLYGHDYGIEKVLFTADSKKVLSFCYRSKTLLIHRVSTGRLIKRVVFNTKARLMRSGFSKDLRYVALDRGTRISLWDVGTGDKIRDFKKGVHIAGVYSLCFSPDGKYLASGGGSSYNTQDGSVKIWEVQTGKLIKTIRAHEADVHLAFTPDGKYLVSASTDRSIKIWDTKNYNLVKKLTANYEAFWSVSVSKDMTCIAAGTAGGYVVIWRTSRLGLY